MVEINPKTKKPYVRSKEFRERRSGTGNPCSGKHFVCSDDKKEKMSIIMKGKKSHLGHHHSPETKRLLSELKKGKTRGPTPPEVREKLRQSNLGKSRSDEVCERMSVSAKERVKRNFHLVVNFNPNACEWFSAFDKDNNTKGFYATNGGEKQIEGTGYFVDYFNPELKLIIEWDEKYHFRNGKLKNEDAVRQDEIQKVYPDYKFIRIKEGEAHGVTSS